MKTQLIRYLQISFIVLLVLPLLIVFFTTKTESQGFGKTYNIDPVHSAIIFRVKHMDITYNYGRFNEFSGNIILDEVEISESKVALEVKTDSVDTANAKRDQHLRNPDFFNAKQFPVITFNSTEVRAKSGQENMLEVTGDLELHGVKKSITVDVQMTGKGKTLDRGNIIGYETTFTIKRSEYGMNFGTQSVSDDVRITVSVEASTQ